VYDNAASKFAKQFLYSGDTSPIDHAFESGGKVAYLPVRGLLGTEWGVVAKFTFSGAAPVNGSNSVMIETELEDVEGPVPFPLTIRNPALVSFLIDRTQYAWLFGQHAPVQDATDFVARYAALLEAMASTALRPASDLRQEEKEELLSRSLSGIVPHLDNVNRRWFLDELRDFVEVKELFYFLAPVAEATQTAGRRVYDQLAGGSPARLGISRGWRIQVDGDDVRSEFLNTPQATVGLPVRIGKERAFLDFLNDYKTHTIEAADLELADRIAQRRDREKLAAKSNISEDSVKLDVVTPFYDELTGPIRYLGEALYPVLETFKVDEFLEGVLYDPIEL
jgi:hypothetical protein